MKLFSLALAVAAGVVLVIGSAAGVAMLQPRFMQDDSVVEPGRESTADVAALDLMSGVMLPWPRVEEGRSVVFQAEGLRLTFAQVTASAAPVLRVSDDQGGATELAGVVKVSAVDENLIGVGRLSGPDGPASAIVATPAEQPGMSRLRIVYLAKAGLRTLDAGVFPSTSLETFPRDLDADGELEWTIPDQRFSLSFGDASPPPPRIYQVRDGRWTDVSADDRYREVFSRHMSSSHRLCELGSEGACAAFVASALRLDRGEWAWGLMLSSIGREPDAAAACSESSSCDANDFPERLRLFLLRTGYAGGGANLRSGG